MTDVPIHREQVTFAEGVHSRGEALAAAEALATENGAKTDADASAVAGRCVPSDGGDVVSAAELRARCTWQLIRGATNRWTLAGGPSAQSVEDLCGAGVPVDGHTNPLTGQQIQLVTFPDGGLISYVLADGRLLHTLNTKTPYLQKRLELGLIALAAPRNTRAPEVGLDLAATETPEPGTTDFDPQSSVAN